MALTLDGTAQARLTSAVVGAHWLAELDFTTGMQRFTTAPVNVVSGSTYLGLGQAFSVGTLSESADISATKITLGLSVVDAAMVSGALGAVDTYRGRAVRLYLQLFDDKFAPAGAKVLRWSGYMNPVAIKITKGGDGSSSGRVDLPCTRAGMSRARTYQGLRLTHAQQILRFPGDLGIQYLADIIDKPATWLSKRFQELK